MPNRKPTPAPKTPPLTRRVGALAVGFGLGAAACGGEVSAIPPTAGTATMDASANSMETTSPPQPMSTGIAVPPTPPPPHIVPPVYLPPPADDAGTPADRAIAFDSSANSTGSTDASLIPPLPPPLRGPPLLPPK